MSDDGHLNRVRKLLAKAERAATEDESAAYTKMAHKLIARHRIDAALLAAAGGADRPPDPISQKKIPLHAPYCDAKARLLGWTGAAFDLKWVVHRSPGAKTPAAVTLFGFRSDIERAEMLYTSLLLQATSLVTRVYGHDGQRGPALTSYRRSWLLGFAARIHSRLIDVQKQAVQETGAGASGAGAGAELVLVHRRDLVQHAYDQAFPNLKRLAPVRNHDGRGYIAGALAGNRADLAVARRVGSSSTRALN